jgi:integrase
MTSAARLFAISNESAYRGKRSVDRRKTMTWWIQYSVKGRRFRESSNSRVRHDAEALLWERLEAAARGERVGPRRATFEDLTEILLSHYRVNGRRSVGRTEDAAIHLRRFFEGVKLDQIDCDLIARYVSSRQNEQAASATINRELAVLRRAFKLVQLAGKVMSRPEVSTLPEENHRRGFFQDHEYQPVLDNLPEHLRPVFQTAYVTGWRINSEILTLQKHHLDLESDCLLFTPGEPGKQCIREFPLTPELREVLAPQLERTSKFERLRKGSTMAFPPKRAANQGFSQSMGGRLSAGRRTRQSAR